ncbi:phosphoadenylyl-sulfate reductase [Fulvivirga sp. M361]|uniref:phosphoadenylyl-sulfate reductase n=1 Tax=Fulvivirga sp. M361 TaxID=2594266 RepID=UPI00117B2314|nr:phosphoadenylyl-sulfate reductase [Fulvivirga sp. M361]TRX56119.1 phosphoadenylyl-sulfate reductase [Fulvivirga sp. M361]
MTFTESLNKRYSGLRPEERLQLLFDSFPEREILITSSFGASSAVLLHMLSKVKPDHPVYFVDTQYHFQETIDYKNQLVKLFHLNVEDVKAKTNHARFTNENSTWKLNTDLCCFINKVQPVNELKEKHSIWISGLLKYQNANRSKMQVFERKAGIVKFHPMLDMTRDEVELYSYINELPSHPLIEKGYDSIGCTHCTVKGHGRQGRWANTKKVECGLHL